MQALRLNNNYWKEKIHAYFPDTAEVLLFRHLQRQGEGAQTSSNKHPLTYAVRGQVPLGRTNMVSVGYC